MCVVRNERWTNCRVSTHTHCFRIAPSSHPSLSSPWPPRPTVTSVDRWHLRTDSKRKHHHQRSLSRDSDGKVITDTNRGIQDRWQVQMDKRNFPSPLFGGSPERRVGTIAAFMGTKTGFPGQPRTPFYSGSGTPSPWPSPEESPRRLTQHGPRTLRLALLG